MSLLFTKSLTDVVKGIRANPKDEATYINKCIAEIKEELKSRNNSIKAQALLKLIYLQMFGYDMSWASFHAVDCMSFPKFKHKRLGFLAASQLFKPDTEVILLTTNLFKKSFASTVPYENGLAISTLSNICTPDLARDLCSDLVGMLNSSKPYIRKKSVLVLYKIFLQFPETLPPAFPRLKEKLEDPDISVVSCTVNVICELARKNPQNYLSLAPILYKLLTNSGSNWMLIKIVKLLRALIPHEPRLAKKLVSPLNELMNTTPAKSLLYECIKTTTSTMTAYPQLIRLAAEKLSSFVEESDQNLKYLGLLGLTDLLKIDPKLLNPHREMVMTCLQDEDITIRKQALKLVVGLIDRSNIVEIVKKLLCVLETSDNIYRVDIIEQIICTCSQNTYEYITSFQW